LNFLTKELRDQVKAELILLKLVQNEEVDSTESPSPKKKAAFDILLGEEIDTSSSNCFETEVDLSQRYERCFKKLNVTFVLFSFSRKRYYLIHLMHTLN
jgi:hypothetical protein